MRRVSVEGRTNTDPWAALDATAQAELVRRGEVSREELVRAACERIEVLDGLLGAVPVRFFEQALAAARNVTDGARFAGVPFLMKDVGARQAGQPYYAGNRALRDADYRAESDTLLGARFRELGLVTVGNSSAPEFGLQSNTWPLAYGPTRNPWDPTRAAGGSSGGACAAVAAGLVPVAHASDGAGSIRIPAAWCGLVGMKPSRDRIAWRHAGKGRPEIEFVVARSLRDTASFLDELQPPRERARGPGRFLASTRRPPPALRVGFTCRAPDGSPVDTACTRAVLRTAQTLASNGHEADEARPDTLAQCAERALHGAVLGIAEYRGCLDELEARLGRLVTPEDVEPFLWVLANLFDGARSTRDLEAAARWNRDWVARTLEWFGHYDLLLCPTVCEPAPALDVLDPTRHEPLELLGRMLPHMAFTEPWNATGQPALSLPLGRSAAGLPVGVQLVAGPGRDDLLLQTAASLLGSDPLPRPPLHA